MSLITFIAGYCIIAYGISLGAYMLRHWVYAHNYSWIEAE